MPHRPNHRGRQYRRNYAHGGPHARANEFRNRRTGQAVPAGAPYHMHPDKGPMEGAVHNPDIPGGTAGHDFYDRVNGNRPMGGPDPGEGRAANLATPEFIMNQLGTQTQASNINPIRRNPGMNRRTSSGGGYQRGGRTRRRMEHGGHTHQHVHTLHQPFDVNHMFTDGVFDYQEAGHTHSPHTRRRSIQTSAPDQSMGYWNQRDGKAHSSEYEHEDYIGGLPRRRGGRVHGRRMEHGGSHCGPGLMYQNGGCVSYEHGGHHQVINSDGDRQRRKR